MGDLSQGLVLLRTVMSLAAVIALILILSWAAKKYLRPERWAGTSFSNIQIIQMFSIEPKKKLLIVEVDKKRLLLGLSENSISSLCVLSDGAQTGKETGTQLGAQNETREVSRAASL